MYIKVQKIISEIVGRDIGPSSIAFDSRLCAIDSLFFAMKGHNTDGRLFAKEVLEKGSYVVADTVDAPASFLELKHNKIIIVDNILDTIVKIAEKIRELIPMVIGITGSSGKTFTKNAIGKLLSDNFEGVLVPEANYNTEYGLLLALSKVDEKTKYAVLELGIGKPGDMNILGKIARPDRLVVLPIEMAHLGKFKNREDLIKEKLKIIEYMSQDSLVIAHESLREYLDKTNITFYSDSNLIFDEKVTHLKAQIDVAGEKILIENVNFYGKHILENMVAVFLLLRDLLPIQKIIAGLQILEPAEGRNKIYDLELNEVKFKLYDSSYNANAGANGSMMRELQAVSGMKGDLILILGGMLMVGEDSDNCHKEVLSYAKTLTKNIILIGKEWPNDEFSENLPDINVEKIIKLLFSTLKEGCIVFLKGSNKYGLSLVSKKLRDPQRSSNVI